MQIIAMTNQKGGVGKTTSTVNLGAGLSKLKKKVLLIDLDPQAHLTHSMGAKGDEIKKTVYDLLRNEAKVEDALIEKNGIHLIPSTRAMAGAEFELAGIAGRELLLKESLGNLTGYDYILLDCPPSLGILTLNALTTANKIYIPVQTEYLALQGMSQLLDVVEIVRKRLNKKITISGIIATRFTKRKVLNQDAINNLQQHFGDLLFNTFIRENIALAEAPSAGKTIFDYKAESHGAEDYLALSKEVLGRVQ